MAMIINKQINVPEADHQTQLMSIPWFVCCIKEKELNILQGALVDLKDLTVWRETDVLILCGKFSCQWVEFSNRSYTPRITYISTHAHLCPVGPRRPQEAATQAWLILHWLFVQEIRNHFLLWETAFPIIRTQVCMRRNASYTAFA